MSRKQHWILTAFLGAAALTAVLFAASAALRAGAAQQALEDTYARHVLETHEQLQAIAAKLAKTPVAADVRTRVELLSAISREANGVVGGLTALPLSHAAMADTVRFCNQLSEYALHLALLAASGSGPAEAEAVRLQELRSQCTLLLGQLATAQQRMLADGMRMAPESSVFYSEAQRESRPLEQVADPDSGMDYPSMIYDGAFSDARRTGAPRGLNPTQVDQQTALEIARSYIGEDRVRSARPGPAAGGVMPAHGVTLTLHDGLVLNAEVTVQGGQLLWIMPEQASFQPQLTLEECTAKAEAFLQKHGYGPMEASHYQLYDGLAVIHFAALQDGVLLYPDQLKLQLRMDTGEVVGLEAQQYLMNHTRRTGLTAALTQQQAAEWLSPHLQLTGLRLCVIPYNGGERLCYEASGLYEQQEYRVYLDAATGEEAQVLMMVDGVNGPMAV